MGCRHHRQSRCHGFGLLVALENLFPPIPSEIVLPVTSQLAGQGEMNLVIAIVAATLGSL